MGYFQSKLVADHCVDELARRSMRRAPHAYFAARASQSVSQGPQDRVVPLRGVQGKARSPVTYCSQQRAPTGPTESLLPGFTEGRIIIALLCVCVCVRSPASRAYRRKSCSAS